MWLAGVSLLQFVYPVVLPVRNTAVAWVLLHFGTALIEFRSETWIQGNHFPLLYLQPRKRVVWLPGTVAHCS